jgi:hypothetical protein
MEEDVSKIMITSEACDPESCAAATWKAAVKNNDNNTDKDLDHIAGLLRFYQSGVVEQ